MDRLDAVNLLREQTEDASAAHSIMNVLGIQVGNLCERVAWLNKARLTALEGCNEAQKRWEAVVAERDTLAARVKEIEDSCLVVSGLNLREDFHTARRVTVEFSYGPGSKRDMMTLVLKDSGEHLAPLPDPDVREMPFKETGDEVKSEKWLDDLAALNMWRERAVKCQKSLRNIRAMTGDWSFCIDEDWGVDDDS